MFNKATPINEEIKLSGIPYKPVISLPLYRNDMNLPIGVQFSAEFANEWALYTIVGELERARPWVNSKLEVAST